MFCLLLMVPVAAFATVCKSVDENGIVTYTQVPEAECPRGVAMPGPVSGTLMERAGAVDGDVAEGEVAARSYRSVTFADPEPDGTVRSNDGSFAVRVALDPGLRSAHFLTVYIDGQAFRGRYGEDEVAVKGIERGTHSLEAAVSDKRGQVLARTEAIQFTLHRAPSRLQVQGAKGDKVWGSFGGTQVEGSTVTIALPGTGDDTYEGEVQEDGVWVVEVPADVLAAAERIDVSVRTGGLEFRQSRDAGQLKYLPGEPPDYEPGADPDYDPGQVDYSSPGNAISTTPGQTNPAFTPNYTR